MTKLRKVSTFAAAATLITTLIGATGSGAVAQEPNFPDYQAQVALPSVSEPVVQPLPSEEEPRAETQAPSDEPSVSPTTLAQLVAVQPQPDTLSRELECLAGAIYFESKSESLAGQLAVGRVVHARAKSGRFPSSYCGVVFQRSQFSFVRGQSMPGINKNSRQWRTAVAMAQIADSGSWKSPVEGALFFHATHVSPGWRLKRVARVDNHVFYR